MPLPGGDESSPGTGANMVVDGGWSGPWLATVDELADSDEADGFRSPSVIVEVNGVPGSSR